jgi:hypothetical protein
MQRRLAKLLGGAVCGLGLPLNGYPRIDLREALLLTRRLVPKERRVCLSASYPNQQLDCVQLAVLARVMEARVPKGVHASDVGAAAQKLLHDIAGDRAANGGKSGSATAGGEPTRHCR